jgi:single-strand DNA-binding protein
VVPVVESAVLPPKMSTDGLPRRSLAMNNVNLIGSLIGDPELGFDRSGGEVCAMQIAVQRRGPGGEPEPGVIYIDVSAYGKLARTCSEQLAAGERIGVVGRLERDDSLEQRGPRRSRWEVHAYQVDLLDSVMPPLA